MLMKAEAAERANIIVAADGSGNFRTVQEAINSVPAKNSRNVVILIKNGIYREKLWISNNFITLVGEDRDSTRIVYAELRETWNRDHHGSDWGAGVVNIDSLATDITLANLTVHNNYGSLFGDNKHQFAIRGGGTRVIIVNCNVLADGGDTVSLWNRENGMYYHANCYFEGWVDFVCPRGWCYVTDSKFFGHNLSASIWHDGSMDKDQKFVIRSSSFDGVPGFPLGRNHRDGQFYLINCTFSRNMVNRSIYRPPSSPAPWMWGARSYFFNCHREGGDFDWFKDNLSEAEGAPKESDITPKWTFAGRWDPEETMPAVLPFVWLPKPRDKSSDVEAHSPQLRWTPSRDAVAHLLYFGESNPPGFRQRLTENVYRPERLNPKATYYWRIDEVTEQDTTTGPTWRFTTR